MVAQVRAENKLRAGSAEFEKRTIPRYARDDRVLKSFPPLFLFVILSLSKDRLDPIGHAGKILRTEIGRDDRI